MLINDLLMMQLEWYAPSILYFKGKATKVNLMIQQHHRVHFHEGYSCFFGRVLMWRMNNGHFLEG